MNHDTAKRHICSMIDSILDESASSFLLEDTEWINAEVEHLVVLNPQPRTPEDQFDLDLDAYNLDLTTRIRERSRILSS